MENDILILLGEIKEGQSHTQREIAEIKLLIGKEGGLESRLRGVEGDIKTARAWSAAIGFAVSIIGHGLDWLPFKK